MKKTKTDNLLDLDNLLYTEYAKAVYQKLSKQFEPEDLEKYQFALIALCNEVEYLHRVQKELAHEDLIQEHTNKYGATNDVKNAKSQLLRESFDRFLKCLKELKMTPKQNSGKQLTLDLEDFKL